MNFSSEMTKSRKEGGKVVESSFSAARSTAMATPDPPSHLLLAQMSSHESSLPPTPLQSLNTPLMQHPMAGSLDVAGPPASAPQARNARGLSKKDFELDDISKQMSEYVVKLASMGVNVSHNVASDAIHGKGFRMSGGLQFSPGLVGAGDHLQQNEGSPSKEEMISYMDFINSFHGLEGMGFGVGGEGMMRRSPSGGVREVGGVEGTGRVSPGARTNATNATYGTAMTVEHETVTKTLRGGGGVEEVRRIRRRGRRFWEDTF